ncbi:unnamed protein product [Phyllotreta striolata]|uniref:PSP proline-rich domain-containing protein n=1 Tax=Phyllotreta striolata TaxID=444603 RepID=A0A9N9TWQ1_PHYSR|nr:unnamed protein product [Phyllotreta striolata]
MVSGKQEKRKLPSKEMVFEINDEDVSPDNSDNECKETDAKHFRSDPKFVETVVNAISNLENDNKTDPSNSHVNAVNQENNVTTVVQDDTILILDCIDGEKSQNLVETSLIVLDETGNENGEIEPSYEEGELSVSVNISNQCLPDERTIEIKFSSNDLSETYKTKFLNFFKSFTELSVLKDDQSSLVLKQTHPSDSPFETSSTPDKSKKKKKKTAKKEKACFVLDTNPSQDETPNSAYTKYMSKFHIDLDKEEDPKAPGQVCFNCEGGHCLRDCPLPKNFTKIHSMRQKFKKDKQVSLREALGIDKNQLPPYIYQMRMLGYPPGWLEEAKFVYSNLAMFDPDGKSLRLENRRKQRNLDSTKVIEYPGFNVPMTDDCIDEYKQYRVPPYSEQYNKAAMIEYFENEFSKQQDDFEVQDMDIDNDEDKCNETSNRAEAIREADKNVPSPSLVDLEAQKRNLLAALEDSSALKSDENAGELQDLSESSTANKTFESGGGEEEEETSTANKTFGGEEEEKRSRNVLKSTFGTPILKSGSPYSRLPDADNFTKDVSPVINFENLPNSTGKYEKMSGLLQKVRETLKKPAEVEEETT